LKEPDILKQQNIKPAEVNKKQGKKNFFSLFSKDFSTYSTESLRVPGLYIYGGSGCGKSFLSDIFYDHLAIQ
jgi:predicted ATPase